MMKKEKRVAYEGVVMLRLGIIILIFSAILSVLWTFQNIDQLVSVFFLSIQTNTGIKIMQFISELGSSRAFLIISILFIIVLIWKRDYRALGLYVIIAGVGQFLAPALKEIFQRVRPINTFIEGFGFPSGHTTASVILYGAITFILYTKYGKRAYSVLLIPLIVGLSRLYLNVHWLSDVIGGFFFGGVWLMMCIFIFFSYQKGAKKRQKRQDLKVRS